MPLAKGINAEAIVELPKWYLPHRSKLKTFTVSSHGLTYLENQKPRIC